MHHAHAPDMLPALLVAWLAAQLLLAVAAPRGRCSPRSLLPAVAAPFAT